MILLIALPSACANDIRMEDAHSLSHLADGLLFGCVLDGAGGARDINWPDAQTWAGGDGKEVLWLHLDRTVPGVDRWLAERFNLSQATTDVLVSNETRPRAFHEDQSLIAILRGINFNEGADPDDMIALQIWADAHFVISLRRRHMQSPRQVLADLLAGNGPKTAGDLVVELAERLVANMSHRIVAMNERIDVLEMGVSGGAIEKTLDEIADIRRSCLAMKRYMSPQHEALEQIHRQAPDWMSPTNTRDIRETIDRLRRYLEDIDVSKESALVLQDDLNNRAAHQTNSTMYMLSIVAAIFLPLSFITGLLGINVGGMPGVNSVHAFWITVGVLTILLFVQLYIFKKLKWL